MSNFHHAQKHKKISTCKNSFQLMRSLLKLAFTGHFIVWNIVGKYYKISVRSILTSRILAHAHNHSCKWTQHPLYEIQIGFFIPNKLSIGRHSHLQDYILKSTCCSLIILYYVFCLIYGHNEFGVSCGVCYLMLLKIETAFYLHQLMGFGYEMQFTITVNCTTRLLNITVWIMFKLSY